MDRSKLVAKLQTIDPATTSNQLIPIMSHYWFMGDRVMAYNDQISISVPCKTDFTGAVPATLLGLLKSSKAKEVEFTEQGDDLLIKAAATKIKLPLIPADELTMFTMPEPKSDFKHVMAKSGKFLECLEACMQSTTTDTSTPDYLGVTAMAKDESLQLFACNDETMTYANLHIGELVFKSRVVLSAAFCTQLLKQISSDVKFSTLELHNDYSLATMTNGTILFGRLIDVQKPLDYASIIARNYNTSIISKLVQIPTKLEGILERAVIITDSAVDQTKTSVSVRDGIMRFKSKSAKGEISDSMQVPNHPDVSVMLEARRLRKGLEAGFSHILVTDTCAVMVKGVTNDKGTLTRAEVVYLVAATDPA
jgi:DNA polymerase III sliding clamp (beta) subunit (PCNA family)